MSLSLEAAPEAPAIVRTLVSKSRWLNSALQQDDCTQSVFAEAAKRSQKEVKERAIVAVSCSCRLSQYPALSEEEQARQSSYPGAVSALQEIFSFYKTIQTPGSQLARKGLSYEEISGCNQTMSFFETLWFCRNFEIVPALISKNDLLQIWRELVVLKLYEEREREPLCVYGLTLRMFVGLLGILAVAIAHDPVAGRTLFGPILQTRNLSVKDKCLRLSEYLRLDDVRHVRQRLQTVGRETVALLNFRSRGEKSKEAKVSKPRPHSTGARPQTRRLSVVSTATGSTGTSSMTEAADAEITATHIRKHGYLRPSLFDECWQILEPLAHARQIHAVSTSGPFMDLGTVVHGHAYRFRIELTNLTRNELAVCSITQDGIPPDAISFTYLPEGFASGMARLIDVHISVEGDVAENVLAFLSIRLSQAGGLRDSYLPAETSEVTIVVSYRVLPANLAHLSQPGKQPSLAASMPSRPASAMSTPQHARAAARSTSVSRSGRRLRAASEESGIFDSEGTDSDTIFHRLSQQVDQRMRLDERLKSL